MTPQQLGDYRTASQPAAHPGEDRIAFVVTRIDPIDDSYHRRIWMWDGATTTPYTSGPADFDPKWSPDGTWLAFLRFVGDLPQLAVLRAAGGEAQVITDASRGVWEFAWSPDSNLLAFSARTWRDDLDDDERARRPRRIDSIPYRFDNEGWRHEMQSAIWVVPADGSSDARRLTNGDRDETRPSWHPDGSSVAFLSDRSPGQVRTGRPHVCRASLDAPDIDEVAGPGHWFELTHRPDGQLHGVGDPDVQSWPALISLWRLGDGPTDLTGHLDRSIYGLVAPSPPVWDGDVAVCAHEDAGRVGVVAVRPDGIVDHLVVGDRTVTGFAAGAAGLAFTASTYCVPGDLYVRRPDGTEERLTDLNEGIDLGWVEAEHFQVPSGGSEIDAWVYLPDGAEPVAGLLNIHGGPASQYGFGFFDEFQVYAAAGFAVIACNPRGSSGRGIDHLRAVTGDGWGAVDMEDVINVLEAALERFPRIDTDRLGVMGGSYGGFLTAWLTAHDDRFRSAVVERALLSWESFAGTSDIGSTFPTDYLGAMMPADRERLSAASPLSKADQIECATLVVHAEEDWRCPIEQAEQLFAVLLRSGVEAEMVRFPGEGHELSRSGKPRHRVERFEAILGWHSRHLDLAN